MRLAPMSPIFHMQNCVVLCYYLSNISAKQGKDKPMTLFDQVLQEVDNRLPGATYPYARTRKG